MINSITEIKALSDYTNLCEVRENTNYLLSFKVDKVSVPNVHLHTVDGNCILVRPISSNDLIPNKSYKYPIRLPRDGYIAIKTGCGALMYDIKVEEVI